MNLKIRSLEEYNRASAIYYEFSDSEKQQFIALRNNLELSHVSPIFKPGSTIPSSDELLDRVTQLLALNRNSLAYQAALAAAASNPEDLAVHQALADIYNKMGDRYFEAIETSNILILDPQNASASARLNDLITSQ
jgi:hypothetical protein